MPYVEVKNYKNGNEKFKGGRTPYIPTMREARRVADKCNAKPAIRERGIVYFTVDDGKAI